MNNDKIKSIDFLFKPRNVVIFEAKQKRDKNKHHWHYNEMSLARVLNEVGFHEVNRCQFRQGRCADVALIDNRPESLFMEAIK